MRCLILNLALLFASPVYAVSFAGGDLDISFDTTVSYGLISRLQPPAAELIGIANGGRAYSVNGDDGNLNYSGTGLVSSTLKLTGELKINNRDLGLFLRGSGFRDTRSDSRSGGTDRTPLSADAIQLGGSDISLLGAYIWGDFTVDDMPFSLQIGKQVLGWGESTFIRNGINVTNPVDVSRLRLAGAEIKEGLIPVGIVSAALTVSDELSVEAYWQYDYQRTRIEPAGTYFSTNDFVGAGGSFVTLGFGGVADYIDPGSGLIPNPNSAVKALRAGDILPDQGDEYGIALRIYSPLLHDTEFGFYHIKYHSRLPVVNAVSAAPRAGMAAPGTPPLNNPALPAGYFISYPGGIHLYGLSFNTQLGASDWSLQGEYSFRQDAPLQVDDVELLAAALHFELLDAQCLPAFRGSCASQLGTFGTGVIVPGFIRRDISQLQITATGVFSNILAADQALLIGESAFTRVHGMPDKTKLRLDAPATNLPGNPATAAVLFSGNAGLISPARDFADASSWGYRLAGRLIYNNAVGAFNLLPYIAWRHDVAGNTPGPGGNFIAGFKQMTLGLAAEYQSTWRADLSYTGFFGAGRQNLLQDRDFMAFSISYAY